MSFVQWDSESQRRACSRCNIRGMGIWATCNLEEWIGWSQPRGWPVPLLGSLGLVNTSLIALTTELKWLLSHPSPQLNWAFLEGRDHLYPALYPQCSAQGLTHSRCLLNEWMNERIKKISFFSCTHIKWPHKLVGRVKWEMRLEKIQRIIQAGAALWPQNEYCLLENCKFTEIHSFSKNSQSRLLCARLCGRPWIYSNKQNECGSWSHSYSLMGEIT